MRRVRAVLSRRAFAFKTVCGWFAAAPLPFCLREHCALRGTLYAPRPLPAAFTAGVRACLLRSLPHSRTTIYPALRFAFAACCLQHLGCYAFLPTTTVILMPLPPAYLPTFYHRCFTTDATTYQSPNTAFQRSPAFPCYCYLLFPNITTTTTYIFVLPPRSLFLPLPFVCRAPRTVAGGFVAVLAGYLPFYAFC